MKSFKIYYINIRDFKCKRRSFEEIIERIKPTVIVVTETWMDEDYALEIDGYCKPCRNDRNQDGGGVMIVVRKELKNVTTEVKSTKEYLESLWIVINNERIKLRIGAVYLPQEKDQQVKEIYDIIKEQVKESREREESILIVGDFNCWVGEVIEGNHKRVTRAGKTLLNMVEKEGLSLVNVSKICKGRWTRAENNLKSVLDYVLVDEELGEHLQKMEIFDKDKDLSPFRLKRETSKKIRMVYSDHNPIIVETDLVTMMVELMEKKKRAVMTRDGREKYKKDLQKMKISQIWDNSKDSIQDMYDKWEEQVMQTRKQNETIKKSNYKRKSKTMRMLMSEKKKLKGQMKGSTDDGGLEKLKELKEKILLEEHESYYRKLKKNCEEISKDGRFNSGGFWKLKKKMTRRKETIHAVEDAEGKLLTNHKEIVDRYGEYFEDLLTTTNKKTELPENQKIVQEVEKKFQKMMEEASKQPAVETEEALVERVIKDIKMGKARDSQDWNNEMMKDGGPEMIKSIKKMADKVKQKHEIPKQWNTMMIRSVDKKGKKEDLKNKRGLFLTNVVSKVFEKIQDRESEVTYDPFQNGGQKGRGTVDNWMLVHALIDEGRRLNKPVYLFFGDLVKCFDRLWLKDCVVDLHECGMRARDAAMVYKLNEEAVFRVITPAGETKPITVREIVKQGTVFGPKLCCASTGSINKGLGKEERIYPSVGIQAVTFVDDINGGGSKQFVHAVMVSCQKKEVEKLWEFSLDKSKWMCIRNRKKEVEEIEVEIKQGKIGQTSIYKFLGNYVNEKGNMDDQLQHMEASAISLIREANKLCCRNNVGKYEMEAKKLVYGSMIVQALFYNIETWTNLRKSDKEHLEILQGKVIKGIFGLPKTTPYWGLLYELDILPIKLLLTYRKLMLYHCILNSDDRRIIKHLVKEQERSGNKECWYGNVKEEGESIGIVVSEEEVVGKSKSKWKRMVKLKVKQAFEKEVDEKRKTSKKMRFLQKKGAETYLKSLCNDDARLALIIRLNMSNWIDDNFGKSGCCPLCEEEMDTTEHVFSCVSTDNKNNVTVKNLEEGEQMKDIVELFKMAEENRRNWMLDEINENLDRMLVEGTMNKSG